MYFYLNYTLISLKTNEYGSVTFFLMLILFLQRLINEILGIGRKVSSVQSVTQSCTTLCHSMYCSTPGLPAHHKLQELTQNHVHQVSNATQPSHPLSSLSPPIFNLSWNQDLSQRVSSSHQVSKVLEFQLQHQSFQ